MLAGAVALVATFAGVGLALNGATLPVASVADLAPQNTLFFVRATNLADTYKAMQDTEAYGDLQASRLANSFLESREWQGMREEFDSRATKLGLAPNAETYLSFIGREVAFAMVPVVKEGRTDTDPAPLMMYRIDTAGLMKTLATENPAGLIQLLTDRYFEGEESKPKAEAYGGYDIFEMNYGGYYALLRDVAVASPELSLIKGAIDRANAGGAGGLGQADAFTGDMGRVAAEGNVAELWVNAGLLRDPAFYTSLGAGDQAPTAFLTSFDAFIKPTPGFAIAATLPAGDLYQTSLTFSRTEAELFHDNASEAIGGVAAGDDTAMAMTLHDLRGLVADAKEAPLFKELRDEMLNTDLSAFFDTDAGREMTREMFGQAITLPPVPEGAEWNTRFEARIVEHLAGLAFDGLAMGDLAFAMGPLPEAQRQNAQVPMSMRGAVKLTPALRLAAAFGISAAAQEGDKEFSVELQENGRTFGTINDYDWNTETHKPVAFLTMVGDTFLVSTDPGYVKNAATSGKFGEAAPSKLSEGPFMSMTGDYKKLGEFLEVMAQGEMPPDMLGSFGDLGQFEMGLYAREGFTSLAAETWINYDPEGSRLAGLYNVEGGPFQAWSVLPEATILQLHMRSDFSALFEYYAGMLGSPEDIDEALSEVGEMLGTDIRSELIPALGSEIGLAVIRQPGAEGTMAAPAVSLTLTVKDRAVVTKALDNARQALAPELPEGTTDEERAGVATYETINAGDVTLHLVHPPAESGTEQQFGNTVLPGYAFFGDLLVVTSGADTLATGAALSRGEGTPLHKGAVFGRLADKTRAASSTSHYHLEFQGLLGLVDENAASLAQAFAPSGGYYPPPLPENADEQALEEWQKEMEAYEVEYQKQRQVNIENTQGMIREGCQNLGWLDYAAGSAWKEAEGELRGFAEIKASR
jgi:hypothetical protein